MKKRTILRMFTVPLVLIILLQAVISGASIIFSNSMTKLSDYAVDFLRKSVETRNVIVKSNMEQNKDSISEILDEINSVMGKELEKNNITVEQFLRNETLQNEFIEQISESCLAVLLRDTLTGSFVVLGNPDGNSDYYNLNGVYFRDSEPYVNSNAYDDIYIKRGSRELAESLNIPHAVYWKYQIQVLNSGEREADNFFYRPLEAGMENPHTKSMNLGYWSKLFSLEQESNRDNYKMMTYSVPLVYHDGTVYGVIGIEVSLDHLQGMLPAKDLGDEDFGGYLLAQYKANGDLQPIAATGQAAGHIASRVEQDDFKETNYDNLYSINEKIEGVQENLAVYSMDLDLYEAGSPFADEEWIVYGVQKYDKIFGVGRDIVISLSLGILIAFLFSAAAIYFLVRRLIKPITNLAQSIRSDNQTKLGEYKKANILEIDELFEVVEHLTEVQQQNEYNLIEEKERYKIALQSSTDVLFSCDFANNTIELLNFNNENQNLNDSFVQDWDEWLMESKMLQPYYRLKALELFNKAESDIEEEIKARVSKDAPYVWVLLKGKVIYDMNGKRSKLIGSVQNINEKKEAELKALELQRVDSVTGLLKYDYGEGVILEALEHEASGCLALIDIDHFYELNGTYGMVFGDTILEEIGKLISEYIQRINEIREKRVVAIRAGGDEILLWFEGISARQVREDLKILQKQVQGLYTGINFTLSITGGITETKKERSVFNILFSQVKMALEFAKKNGNGNNHFVAYEELTSTQLSGLGNLSINEIASVPYQETLSIVSIVFNFFDKGGDINNIIPILFTKLGRYFDAETITMVMVDRDFKTSYINFIWEDLKGSNDKKFVNHFSAEEFAGILETLDNEAREYFNLLELNEVQKKFFFTHNTLKGINVPMFDNGEYIGSINFVQKKDSPEWTEEERNEIQKITKIIETNCNKEKYDMASRAKRDFLSRMSHEMRTPMNAIMGMAAIALAQKEEPDQVEESLKKIEQSSRYLLSLVNDILDMSKIESGKMRLAYHNFNLNEAVNSIVDLIAPQVQAKNLKFNLEVSLIHNWVVGDMLHLNQILINLLGNAVKFTPDGGTVTLTVNQVNETKTETLVYFSVKDTGIGISSENQTKIFHSFEQADDDVSGQYGGTGLGLAISSSLVNLMDGVLELESNLGQGSNFFFQISMEKGIPEYYVEDEEDKLDESKLIGKRVLLVDDNDLNIEIAQALLEMQGLVVETAFNGLEALEKYEEKEAYYFDMILMDIRMPVMNGLEAAKAIRKVNKEDAQQIPIVAMTANAFDEDMKKSIDSGMNGHLSKPIDIKVMLDMIKRVMK